MNEFKTIFLVDDDEDDRMLLREALTDVIDAVRVVDVVSGEALFPALGRAGEGSKLILMDMNMPRVNGLEMLGRLKGDSAYMHIPVVMVSTSTNQRLITQAYELGANAFIVKPVTLDEYELVARGVGLCFLNNFRLAAPGAMPTLSDGKTIVVVEDSDDHWLLFERALRTAPTKYHLLRIDTKERALAFAGDELAGYQPAVDMILVDLYLPQRQDGLQLLSGMRTALQMQNLDHIPMIVFTYSDLPEDIDDCYRSQANAYLIKPADISGWRFYFENLLHFWSAAIKPAHTNFRVRPRSN